MTSTSRILSPKSLYFVVFISGMTSLGLEMAASRLLGNVFGSSNLVWASIIGLILIYLTVGYFVGGRLADRHPEPALFCKILIFAGFSGVIIPVIAQPILRFAADAFDLLNLGVLAGSFVSVMVLMLLPMILLGTASPFAIRLSMDDTASAGQVSGKIYAISTLGSFIGTFLPSLILIPLIGTYRTFVLFGTILIAIALFFLLKLQGWRRSWLFLAIFVVSSVLLIVGSLGRIKQSAGQVFEGESAYNYIQVLQQDGYYMLRLNEGQGVHSVYKADQDNFFGPWEQFLVGPFFNDPPFAVQEVKSIGIVGLAAGTTARAATHVFGDIPIDGWEIDPQIINVGQKYFAMNEPNLHVYAQDGRWGLEKSSRKYSLIAIDAYRPPYIPPHLTTVEFFRIVYDHLDENGSVVINVGRSLNDRRLIDDMTATIKQVFPSVYVMDLPDTFNSMIFATRKPTRESNLLQNFIQLSQQPETSSLLLETMQISIANLQEVPDTGTVYTDDLAPIEWVTNTMVLNFILSDDVSTLQE